MSDISSGVRPCGFTLFLIDSRQLALLLASSSHTKNVYLYSLFGIRGIPSWHSGKESACQCKEHRRHGFNPWVGKIPWRRKWQPTPVFLPGKSHGQRSLAGFTKSRAQLSTHRHTYMELVTLSMPRLICAVFHWLMLGTQLHTQKCPYRSQECSWEMRFTRSLLQSIDHKNTQKNYTQNIFMTQINTMVWSPT